MANPRKSKRIANFAQAAVYTLVFIAILGAVNFLANRYNQSYDATANKRFTLSDQTQRIARELDQDVTIAYWDRPSEFTFAADLLDRYDNLSSHVKIVYEDIAKNNLRAREVGVSHEGQIFVEFGNRREEAGGLTEQEVTGAMVRAIQGGERVVCFATGYGEADANNTEASGYADTKRWTEANNYKTQIVPLLPTPTIPGDCTILVLAGPQRDYLPPAVDAIRSYVESGGRALIMLDPPLEIGSPIDENQGLVDVLSSWGVTANRDMVLDLSGAGQLYGMGPQLAVVNKFDRHAIVAQMGNFSVGMPITRSLTRQETTNTTVETLFESAEDSVVTTDLSAAEIAINPDSAAPRVLAVAGTYTVDDGTPLGQEPPADENKVLAGNGHFVVVGNSRWASNGFLRFNGNSDLYLNMLNWLSSDENLIAIRPKDPEDRRLNMNQAQVSLLFYGSVVFLPLLMMAAGLSVWWRRR